MPSIPWSSRTDPQPQSAWDTLVSNLKTRIENTPSSVLAPSAFALGSVSTVVATVLYARYFRRYPNGDWVTPDVFARKQWVKGVVTSVGDADNFRLYHTPAFGWRWPLKFRGIPDTSKDLKDKTLHIRIAGVDAPEAGHFGRPAQPYSVESLAWLKDKVLGKTLYCQLLRRDQYARIVSIVVMPPRFLPATFVAGKSLSLEMLKSGWVTTYEQAGAEYGKWGKDEFLRVEAEARAAKQGMWKYGSGGETPAEYKRRYALQADGGEPPKVVTSKKEKSSSSTSPALGWFQRLWSKP